MKQFFNLRFWVLFKKKKKIMYFGYSLFLKYFSWQDIFLVGYDGRYLVIILSIGVSMASLFWILCEKHIFWIFYRLCWYRTFSLLRTLKQFFSLSFKCCEKKLMHLGSLFMLILNIIVVNSWQNIYIYIYIYSWLRWKDFSYHLGNWIMNGFFITKI